MVKKNFLFLMALGIGVFLIENVSAHCPLCTIGAGAAAAGAVWLGVSKVVVGLFIGGFSMSMGLWMSRLIKKKYFKFQKELIVVGVFLLTLLPLLPIFSAIGPLHFSFIGEYGKTFAINYSLISGLFGGLIVFSSPSLSRKITKKRNGKIIPFQGTMLTIILLIIVGIILQFTISGLVVGSGVISGGSIEKFSPKDFENVIQNEEVFVLNVHTPYYGQIEGTDLIIEDWENIEKYMDKLPKDTSIPIAVYCRSGSMSGIVAEKLNGMGYKVYDLEGGMNSWENSGRNLII
jgi:rhodanese-related sulfurtransferase